jgi:hypothetical protein
VRQSTTALWSTKELLLIISVHTTDEKERIVMVQKPSLEIAGQDRSMSQREYQKGGTMTNEEKNREKEGLKRASFLGVE